MTASPEPFPIELIAFPGAPNLPIFVAQEKGFFEKAGVRVNLTTTPSSAYQAENLIGGKFHIAGTAFDNVVAYQEGQGAVALKKQPDLFAFMGATQIELAFVVAPDIQSYADLKGKSLALDALSTGFAFVLYDMLKRGGLERGDYELVAVGATPAEAEAYAREASAQHGRIAAVSMRSFEQERQSWLGRRRRVTAAAAPLRVANGRIPD